MDIFIIALREGIEAALVVGIILTYLTKTNRLDLRKSALAGIVGAVLFSIFGAVALKVSGIDMEKPIIEGIVLFTAAFFVGSMVVWMYKTGRFLKKNMEEKMEGIAANAKGSTFQSIAIFLFAFLMIGREGIETTLMLMAVSYRDASLVLTYGAAFAGFAISIVFGYLIIKGSVKVNLSKFFNYTSIVLLILTLKLTAGGLHEFGEIGLVPESIGESSLVDFLIKDNVGIFILVAMIAIPVVMILIESLNKNNTSDPKKLAVTKNS